MTKCALITGITGQDGTYLAELLLSKGYQVFGTVRSIGTSRLDRLNEIGIADRVGLVPLDILDIKDIAGLLEKVRPDEIYNLAAQSSVARSFEQPLDTGECTGMGTARLLEAAKILNPKIKFYQASTSEMFGKVQGAPQNENTPFYPCSPYAIAKLYAHLMTVNYREAYGMFCCAGILFNHESPMRGFEYVTRKITAAVAQIKLGRAAELRLGNLSVRRDWGYAPEYVEAMWLMMQQDQPGDYVIATGRDHSVQQFVEEAFNCADLDWRDYVVIDPAFYRPAELKAVVGDPAKAKKVLNWEPRTTFKEIIRLMVEADIKRAGQNNLP